MGFDVAVDVADESEDGGPGFCLGKVLESVVIEFGDFGANFHHFCDLRGGEFFHFGGEEVGFFLKDWGGGCEVFGYCGGEIEGFGGGKDDEH